MEENNIQNYYKRFRVYSKMMKYTNALNDLNSALLIDPKFTQALSRRAKLNLQLGSFDKAIEDSNNLLNIEKDSSIGISVKNDAIKAIENEKQANILYNQGNFKEAIDLFTQVSDIASCSAKYRMIKCKCMMEIGDYYGVISESGALLKINKDDLDALLIRGNAHLHLGDEEMANRHYRQCLLSDPEYKPCKDASKLLKQFTKALKNADEECNNQQFDEAISDLEKANKLNLPGNENVLLFNI